MRRRLLGLLALLLMAVPLPAAAVGTRILLVARDHEEHPLSGFCFAYQGLETLPTSRAGATKLDLPPTETGSGPTEAGFGPAEMGTVLVRRTPDQVRRPTVRVRWTTVRMRWTLVRMRQTTVPVR